MTFFEKIQAHESGLVRLDIPTFRAERFLSGKTGMVCSVDVSAQAVLGQTAAKVTLFIDEKVYTVFLFEKEVKFLEGRQ